MLYMATNSAHAWAMRRKGYSLGWMMSPDGWRHPRRDGHEDMPFALDNGFFHPPDKPQQIQRRMPGFWRMLDKCDAGGFEPIFVVAPDIPYCGSESLRFSVRYFAKIRREFAYPLALAVQDGMTIDALDAAPWGAVFVAGSTEWKWRTARHWCEAASDRGLWAHVARVNTADRLRHCIDIGADSADGTGVFRGDRTQLRGVLEALTERRLFGERG